MAVKAAPRPTLGEIHVPALRPMTWPGVAIERLELDGREFWAAQVHEGMDRLPRRRWFPCRALALAHGADMADAHGLPLFDLSLSEGE